MRSTNRPVRKFVIDLRSYVPKDVVTTNSLFFASVFINVIFNESLNDRIFYWNLMRMNKLHGKSRQQNFCTIRSVGKYCVVFDRQFVIYLLVWKLMFIYVHIKSSSYLTENVSRVYYKDQSLNGTNQRLFWEIAVNVRVCEACLCFLHIAVRVRVVTSS